MGADKSKTMAKQIKLKRYEPIEYYAKRLEKLDMQIGECFVAFDRDHNICAMWVVIEKKKGIGGEFVYGVRSIKVMNRGFSRIDKYITPDGVLLEAYTHIVQVDRKRFDTLDKAIALINSQINAYQGEFKNLIEE